MDHGSGIPPYQPPIPDPAPLALLRRMLLGDGATAPQRVDGRGAGELRELKVEAPIRFSAAAARAHGSGLFMRGETQVMSHATLVLILAALAHQQVSYENALALAIGSNVGTTITISLPL